MQLGMIGLGRMGANMVRHLLRGGHQCVVYDFLQQNQRVCPHDRRRDVVTAPRDLTTIPSLPTNRPHGIEPS
jgi:6-phosphogluconate dehydrogenase